MTTIIYEPCPACAGLGSYEPYRPWDAPTSVYPAGVRETCQVCCGSGKGKIKEIHEP